MDFYRTALLMSSTLWKVFWEGLKEEWLHGFPSCLVKMGEEKALLFIKLIHTVTELCQHWLTLVLTVLQGLICSGISTGLPRKIINEHIFFPFCLQTWQSFQDAKKVCWTAKASCPCTLWSVLSCPAIRRSRVLLLVTSQQAQLQRQGQRSWGFPLLGKISICLWDQFNLH